MPINQFIDYETKQTIDCVDSCQLIAELKERLRHSNLADVLPEELLELGNIIAREVTLDC